MQSLSDKELIGELTGRLKAYSQTLEELKELNDELKVVNKKLEDSEALKSHFISNITNEIVNPFASIIGLSKNILYAKKEDWKTIISMVSLIHSEAFNLDFQFKNIFVAAKLEAGEISPEILRVDINSLIEGVLDSFKLEAKKKKVNFALDFNFSPGAEKIYYFKTDPEKLRLIISNLISNSIKFSTENKNIEIQVSMEEANLIIRVKDQGTGISEENQKIIFDRFRRLDTGINSLNRGHGLGLSVNKALLDMLNGTISISSEPGRGAEFIVSIPEHSTEIEGFSYEGTETFFEDEEIF
ncbi:MAG: sensor histidine kinase [Bacteroidales bacterium]